MSYVDWSKRTKIRNGVNTADVSNPSISGNELVEKLGSNYAIIEFEATAAGAFTFDATPLFGSGGTWQETSTNKVNYKPMIFDDSADDFAQIRWTMPENYDGGTITYAVEWKTDSSDTVSAGGVSFFLQGVSITDNDTWDTAFGTAIEVNDDWITADDYHLSAESSAVTIAGSPAGGHHVIFQLYRDVSDADDDLSGGIDNKAWVTGMWITYTVDAESTED